MYLLSLQAIADGIKNVVDFFVMLFQFISNVFSSLVLALSYLIGIIPKIIVLIATLPNWLIAFANITLGVSIAYFIIGRDTGKSGK